MSKKERSAVLFIEEIIDAMERILRFVRTYDEERFLRDEIRSNFETNLKVVWAIISEELPENYEDMKNILKDMESQ